MRLKVLESCWAKDETRQQKLLQGGLPSKMPSIVTVARGPKIICVGRYPLIGCPWDQSAHGRLLSANVKSMIYQVLFIWPSVEIVVRELL